MFLFSLLLSLSTSFSFACVWKGEAFETKVNSSVKITADARQEIVFNGETALPKIVGIKPVGAATKPQLKVISGLQILENGKMKSYPNKISLRLDESEISNTPLAIEVQFESKKKMTKIQVEYVGIQKGGGCTNPDVQPL